MKKPNEIQFDSKGKYPKTVMLIILNEFCERFSYMSMRTILYIFFSKFLALDANTSLLIYHLFTVICYFTPILGAILADGYIGLYKTILSLSCLGGNQFQSNQKEYLTTFFSLFYLSN